MMGGNDGWGMDWGMGSFGGIGTIVVVLVILGIAFFVLRRRNS